MPQRLLLVEDDPTILEVVCAVLGDEGYDAICVETVAAALQFLAGERPACVVLDFHLPDGTAEDVIETIVGLDDCPPVVIVSASPIAPPLAARYRVSLVPKPFDLDVIIAEVANAITSGTRPVAAA